MSKKDGLDAFLRSKASTEPKIDWGARKDRWISEITRLYDQIKEWLAPLEKDEVVRYSTLTMTLQEDPIGSYQVDVLMLLVGKQRVEFRPKGTLIVGANGRVDIQGPRAMRTIVLRDGRWLIVERSPRVKTRPFDKDSLETVLKEVMA